jgi:hypothetical protein
MALAAGAGAMAKFPDARQKAADCLKAAMLVEAYYERYAADWLPTAHNELEVKQHLGGCWWFYGRVDGLVFSLRHGGRPWLYEMKTTTGPCSELELILRQDPQIHLYQEMLQRQYGVECAGTILDIVKKPWSDDKEGGGAVRRRKDEPIEEYVARCKQAMRDDPDRYFLRVYVERDQSRIDNALEALRRTAAGIERGDFYSITGFNCRTPYGSWCEYRDLCWFGDDNRYRTEKTFDGQETSNDDRSNGNDNGQQSGNDTTEERLGEHRPEGPDSAEDQAGAADDAGSGGCKTGAVP